MSTYAPQFWDKKICPKITFMTVACVVYSRWNPRFGHNLRSRAHIIFPKLPLPPSLGLSGCIPLFTPLAGRRNPSKRQTLVGSITLWTNWRAQLLLAHPLEIVTQSENHSIKVMLDRSRSDPMVNPQMATIDFVLEVWPRDLLCRFFAFYPSFGSQIHSFWSRILRMKSWSPLTSRTLTFWAWWVI